MEFTTLFAERLKGVCTIPNYTRHNNNLLPFHKAIAAVIEANSNFHTQTMETSEYEYTNELGSKKIDIAILDENNELKGAILFKSYCSSYNKNANNYYENMKGESSLFIDGNIPIYQIALIPTVIKNTSLRAGWETPSLNSINHYSAFINHKSEYWNLLTFHPFYFDVDYDNWTCKYSESTYIDGVPNTVTEGIVEFVNKIQN